MTGLKKGLGFHNLLPQGDKAVFINTGTQHYRDALLSEVNFNGFKFKPLFDDHAYIPKTDWRPLSKAELRKLNLAEGRVDYNAIYFGEISEKLKNHFDKLEIDNFKSREEVMSRLKEKPQIVEAISQEMNSFLKPMSGGFPYHFHCVAANLPNLEMVACDISRLPANFTTQERKYIGMHNDGTQFMTPYSAHKFGNRITINIGKQARIFYFVNLSMIQAANLLKQKIDLNKQKIDVYNIAELFFKNFPDYPVIKVIQEPYQYYIAPTDNCFHDGSTLGNTKLDVNMVYFGAFRC